MAHSLAAIVLRVADLEASKDFYSALGIEFVLEQHGKGTRHYAALIQPSILLELYPASDAKGATREPRLSFFVSKIEPIIGKLKMMEATVVWKPEPVDWGGRRARVAMTRDFDGRTVELIEPIPE